MRALAKRLSFLGLVLSLAGCGSDAGNKALHLVTTAARIESQPLLAQQAQEGIVIRRVWEGDEPDFWAATPSPDGRLISEIDWNTGNLAVTDLVSGQLKRVTHYGPWSDTSEWAETSVFSPDGRRLAFTSWNSGAFGYEIRAIDVDGSNERTIVPSPSPRFYAMLQDWSADGRSILAMLWYEEPVTQIGLISVADGSIRVLKKMESTRTPDVCALSPDGRFMAFDPHGSEDSEDHDILVMALDGGGETALLTGPTNDRLLGWTRDGSAILFYSDRGMTEGIWMLPVADGKAAGEPTLLRPDVWRLEPIGFSRDAYFFGVTTQQPQAYTAAIDHAEGRLIAAPAAIEDASRGRSGSARWSPDGRYLAYVRTGTNQRNPTLILRPVTGEEGREIPLPPRTRPSVVRWTDGSRALLMNADDPKTGERGVFELDLKTLSFKLLLHYSDLGERAFHVTEFTHDLKTVYYPRYGENEGRTNAIVERGVESGLDRVIAEAKGANRLSLSPDGATLAFREAVGVDTDALATVSVSGGPIVELRRIPTGELWGSAGISWTPDGQYLRYATLDKQAHRWSLWQIPSAGGEPSRIAEFPAADLPGLHAVRFHPDGNRIAFTAGEFRGEIWAVENLPGSKGARTTAAGDGD